MIDRPPSYVVFNSGHFMEFTHDPTIYRRTQADTLSDKVRKEKFEIYNVEHIHEAIRMFEKLISRCKPDAQVVLDCKQSLKELRGHTEGRGR